VSCRVWKEGKLGAATVFLFPIYIELLYSGRGRTDGGSEWLRGFDSREKECFVQRAESSSRTIAIHRVDKLTYVRKDPSLCAVL
jgi:hypothetical protein